MQKNDVSALITERKLRHKKKRKTTKKLNKTDAYQI